jgi:hypothetical protein
VTKIIKDYHMLTENKLPLPLTPSHQGRGNNCCEFL